MLGLGFAYFGFIYHGYRSLWAVTFSFALGGEKSVGFADRFVPPYVSRCSATLMHRFVTSAPAVVASCAFLSSFTAVLLAPNTATPAR